MMLSQKGMLAVLGLLTVLLVVAGIRELLQALPLQELQAGLS